MPPRTLLFFLPRLMCMQETDYESLGPTRLILPFQNNNPKDFKVKNARAVL